MAYSGMNDIARLLMAQQMGQPSMNNAMAVQQPVPQQAIPRGASRSQQLLAQQLMQAGTDTSPVGHWTQALARVVQGGVGGHLQRKQDAAEGERQSAIGEALKGAAGGDREAAMRLLAVDPQLGIGALNLAKPPMNDAPKTREVKSGNELVTQEWDGQKWGDVGRTSLSATEQDGRTREMKNYQFRESLKTQAEKDIFDAGLRAAQVIDLEGGKVALTPNGPRALSTPAAEQAAAAEKAAAVAAAQETGGAQGTAQAKLPKVEASADEMLRVIDLVLDDPALSSVVGSKGIEYGYGLRDKPVSGTAAAGAQAKVDQLKGKAFLEAFESIKGGGTITEQEGKQAAAAFGRLDTAQDEKSYAAALRELKGVIVRQKDRARRQAAGKESAESVIDIGLPGVTVRKK